MPSHIPEIQLDDNWLEDVDVDDFDGHDKGDSVGDDLNLTVADAERRKSSSSRGLEHKKSNGLLGEGQGDQDQGRLEDQMNYDHLRRLENIFEEADQDGQYPINCMRILGLPSAFWAVLENFIRS